MPPLDLVPAAALVVLLVTAYRHPRARTELATGLATAAATLATGILGVAEVGSTLRHLGPVVLFLVTILVVADVCARAGLFAAAAARIRAATSGRPGRLFTGVFLLAALVTTVLSLDATVVLLTPVVVAAATAAGTSVWPGGHACLRMANSASLLLPVSNLTNLLAMPRLDLTFGGFAREMAPALLAVLAVEYAALRLLFRRELAAPAEPREHGADQAIEPLPLVVVGLMLAGFAVGSPLGVDPGWTSTAAAVALVLWARHRGLVTWRAATAAAHPAFAVFVLCLGVVVAALSEGLLGDLVADLLPGGTSWLDLLAIALLATVLANLLTNLSATLLLVPLLAPLGDTAILAALLGLNVGSGLTYTGSLANLLWRRTLVGVGTAPSLAGLHRVSLLATPLSLFSAVSVLSLFK
ncbi:ArsB/NhaD family transporter [Nocardioides hungaricus]